MYVAVGGLVGLGVAVGGLVGLGVTVGGMVGLGVSVGGWVGLGVSVGALVGLGVSVGALVGLGVTVGVFVAGRTSKSVYLQSIPTRQLVQGPSGASSVKAQRRPYSSGTASPETSSPEPQVGSTTHLTATPGSKS
ncbi:MAG: hypothetical protein L6435_13765 [Anaerolineae bacterium]|nr:hypothetical protein [Anaerolineae bacterium]